MLTDKIPGQLDQVPQCIVGMRIVDDHGAARWLRSGHYLKPSRHLLQPGRHGSNPIQGNSAGMRCTCGGDEVIDVHPPGQG